MLGTQTSDNHAHLFAIYELNCHVISVTEIIRQYAVFYNFLKYFANKR